MELRGLGITPHVSQNSDTTDKARRRPAIDGRTMRHAGYVASLRCRKRIEEVFCWIKRASGFRQARHRGLRRVGPQFIVAAIAYNLVRLTRLIGAPP